MDKRKNNRGTKGNKGGRPPKADELQLLETMDAILAPEQVWAAIAKRVLAEDTTAMKIWVSYRHGMPKQQVDVQGDVSHFMAPVIEIPHE